MNKEFDEAFEQLKKAFNLIEKDQVTLMEDVFKHPPLGAKVTTKTTTIDSSNVIRIKLSSWEDRFKASWRILTKGEISIRKKEK